MLACAILLNLPALEECKNLFFFFCNINHAFIYHKYSMLFFGGGRGWGGWKLDSAVCSMCSVEDQKSS